MVWYMWVILYIIIGVIFSAITLNVESYISDNSSWNDKYSDDEDMKVGLPIICTVGWPLFLIIIICLGIFRVLGKLTIYVITKISNQFKLSKKERRG